MKYLILLLALFSFSALADVTATWTPGAPVQGADVQGFNWYYGDSAGNVQQNVINIPDPNSTSHTTTVIPDGVWYAGITAYATNESPMSEIVPFTVVGGVVVKSPNVPTGFSLQ